MRYALIVKKTGLVENVIELEEQHDWVVPKDRLIVPTDVAGPDWTYKEDEFEPPNDAPEK